jgi:uncharacterized protein (DUF2147 family)
MKKLILIASLIASPVFAQSVDGVWLRDTGKSRIRIADCGANKCGTITWVAEAYKDAKNPDESLRARSAVGIRIFYNMAASGSGYKGQAYNPEDGKTYSGTMSVSGNTLTTKGCVLGGLICKSATWSRVN